jgi:L-ribulokinase
VNYIGPHNLGHEELTARAKTLRPGQSGLLALDWNNGNRTILVDPRLSGLLVGQTLQTRPEEIYRALIEATAFGARVIINRFEEYGMRVREVVNCGGISEKNDLLLQIYADVLGRPMKLAASAQTCALGACMTASVAAGKKLGGHASVPAAQKAMCGIKSKVYKPIPQNRKIYDRLFNLYKLLHDGFGGVSGEAQVGKVMKELLTIKENV